METSPRQFFLILLIVQTLTLTSQKSINNTVSAILVFGDSTVDPGNNNYVRTIFKGNFVPYGRDFLNHNPTGRFTNGRLATDYISSYVGLKDYIPPYLDPSLSIKELMTGVSFASAGTGFDPLTAKISNVLDMATQMKYFREYKKKLESVVGKKRLKNHIKRALFLVSAGTNDFVVNYFGLPIRRKSYSISAYQQFLLQHVKQFLQGLWDEGARKIGVNGLPPMGCLPVVITMNSNNAFLQRNCIENFSSIARDYNRQLQFELSFMHNRLAHFGAKIYYADIYDPLIAIILDYGKYGFDYVNSGCCGSGYLEAAFLCNKMSHVCSDATKYVFWDSIHPTEKTYYFVYKALCPTIDMLVKD